MVQKMRKMKDSGIEWIGEIPAGWSIARGKHILTLLQRAVFPTDGVITCFRDGEVTLRSNRREDGFTVSLKEIGYQGIEPGDLVVHGMDGFAGSIGISDSRGKSSPVLVVLDSSQDKKYLMYYLRSMAYNNVFLALSTGIRVRSCDLKWNKLADLLYLVPPIVEQHKLVSFLDEKCSEIDAMLSKTRASIEEYKKLKQAVITQAVTKGVRGEREMKDSGVEWIGEIPKEWICEKIKYATSISRGLFNHRPRNDERYYNGKYPFIQTGDVANATKYIVSYSQTLNELGKAVSKEFPKGTLTMTIAANVGDVAILNFDAYFPDSVVGFIPNKNIRTLYLFYVFSSMKDEFTRTAIKSTQLNLNIDRVKETFIPVTLSVTEQCEIENYLESKCAEIDGLIAKKEQLVKELESYKKSLIYEVVTGKREV
jgi:type I restriction enzyme, S subunit